MTYDYPESMNEEEKRFFDDKTPAEMEEMKQ